MRKHVSKQGITIGQMHVKVEFVTVPASLPFGRSSLLFSALLLISVLFSDFSKIFYFRRSAQCSNKRFLAQTLKLKTLGLE